MTSNALPLRELAGQHHQRNPGKFLDGRDTSYEFGHHNYIASFLDYVEDTPTNKKPDRQLLNFCEEVCAGDGLEFRYFNTYIMPYLFQRVPETAHDDLGLLGAIFRKAETLGYAWGDAQLAEGRDAEESLHRKAEILKLGYMEHFATRRFGDWKGLQTLMLESLRSGLVSALAN